MLLLNEAHGFIYQHTGRLSLVVLQDPSTLRIFVFLSISDNRKAGLLYQPEWPSMRDKTAGLSGATASSSCLVETPFPSRSLGPILPLRSTLLLQLFDFERHSSQDLFLAEPFQIEDSQRPAGAERMEVRVDQARDHQFLSQVDDLVFFPIKGLTSLALRPGRSGSPRYGTACALGSSALKVSTFPFDKTRSALRGSLMPETKGQRKNGRPKESGISCRF